MAGAQGGSESEAQWGAGLLNSRVEGLKCGCGVNQVRKPGGHEEAAGAERPWGYGHQREQ